MVLVLGALILLAFIATHTLSTCHANYHLAHIPRRGDRPRSPASVRVAVYVESYAFSQFKHGRSGTIAPTKSSIFIIHYTN